MENQTESLSNIMAAVAALRGDLENHVANAELSFKNGHIEMAFFSLALGRHVASFIDSLIVKAQLLSHFDQIRTQRGKLN